MESSSYMYNLEKHNYDTKDHTDLLLWSIAVVVVIVLFVI